MTKVLDFHHHVTPPEYVRQMEKHGVTGNYGVKFKKFNPRKNLFVMKKAKIDKAFLSISTPGVYVKNDSISAETARICNEYIASMKRDYPGQYGGFASLPLPAKDESLRELEYAMDTLKLDGIAVLSNVQGNYFGEKGYEELFAELNRRKAVVFIHPEDILVHNKGGYGGVTSSLTLERVIDTSRAAYNLFLNGYLEKYRNIKFVLSHGGGAFPMIASKAVSEYFRRKNRVPDEKEFGEKMNLLKGFYNDTAQRGIEILSGLKSFCGGEHIVFGSDMPYQPPFEILAGQKELRNFDRFSPSQKAGILDGSNLGFGE